MVELTFSGFGEFQGIVGHEMGIGFALPNGLAAKIHGVVPMESIEIDGAGPAEINLFDFGAEGAEDLNGFEGFLAHFRIDFDITEIKSNRRFSSP